MIDRYNREANRSIAAAEKLRCNAKVIRQERRQGRGIEVTKEFSPRQLCQSSGNASVTGNRCSHREPMQSPGTDAVTGNRFSHRA